MAIKNLEVVDSDIILRWAISSYFKIEYKVGNPLKGIGYYTEYITKFKNE